MRLQTVSSQRQAQAPTLCLTAPAGRDADSRICSASSMRDMSLARRGTQQHRRRGIDPAAAASRGGQAPQGAGIRGLWQSPGR